eukprot:3707377-Rhodomonas_salina.2
MEEEERGKRLSESMTEQRREAEEGARREERGERKVARWEEGAISLPACCHMSSYLPTRVLSYVILSPYPRAVICHPISLPTCCHMSSYLPERVLSYVILFSYTRAIKCPAMGVRAR